jgi:hypothetical protein
MLELLRQRIEPINEESSLEKYLQPPELPKKIRRTVQWKETNVNNEDVNNMKQFIQFDRNNQAKSNTLSTINTKLLKSQFIEQHSDSNENYDE